MCFFCSYQVKPDVCLYSQGQLTWIKNVWIRISKGIRNHQRVLIYSSVKSKITLRYPSCVMLSESSASSPFVMVLPRIFLFAPSLITHYCFIGPFVMVCYLLLLLLLRLIVLPVLPLKVTSWPLPVFVLSSYLITFVVLNFSSFHGLVTCHNTLHLCLIIFLALRE